TTYFAFLSHRDHRALHSFPTRRSSDLEIQNAVEPAARFERSQCTALERATVRDARRREPPTRLVEQLTIRFQARPAARMLRRERSEEHTSELQSPGHPACRLLLEKKKE